jgi:hypothetical protein
MSEWNPPTPTCPHCGRSMQLNSAVTTEFFRQFLCGCRGTVMHVNLHKGQKGKGE